MFRTLPLAALRTFESTARHLSFKIAAEELAVTPAAVSHQVRSLEEWLGVALFERLPRGVRLTPKGVRLFHTLHGALMDMAQVTGELRTAPSAGRLTLTAPASFAALWLIPRLDRFYALHPDIHLRLDTSADTVDLQQDASVDVAIRYGAGSYPELYSPGRMEERFGVFGTPERVAAAGREGAPALISVQWGKSEMYEAGWVAWCEAAGKEWITAQTTLREYSEEIYAFQAAIAGHGLILASSILIGDTAGRGLLTSYRPEVTVAGGAYTVLCVPGRERHPPVHAFFNWLQGEWKT